MRTTRANARLADIQAQQVEVGRIRLGTSTPKISRSGKEYNEPVKLERFRLTSRSRQLVEQAAELYGGQPGEWTPQGGTVQFEVIIEREWLGVIVPPNACSQYYEQWAGGKCRIRCDGMRELLTDEPCPCGPDPTYRKCKPYTRLSLMLAEMPGVGIWRLETHGYNAAAELPAMADLLSAAGGNIPARLEMEERQAEVPDPRKPGETLISRFMVPVLHVEATPAQLISMFQRPAIEAAPVSGAPDPGPAEPAAVATPQAPPPAKTAAPKAAPTARVVQGFLRAIAKAGDLNELVQVRGAIQASKDLAPEALAQLRDAWNARQGFLSQAGPASAPAAPAVTPAAPPPPAPELDRKTVWMEVNTWAGFNNITLSGLNSRYATWNPDKPELASASAQELAGFRDWLKASK